MKNRTALVTGASSGLGLALVHALVDAGARVALAARRTDRLQAEVEAIKARGGEAFAVPMDVGDEASIIAGYDAVEAALGPVDTVYANAGMSVGGAALELKAEEFDAMMSVNLRGVFLTAREGARRMIRNGAAEKENGRIVLVASIGGVIPIAGVPAYSISKAGVVMMGKSLAKEWVRKGVCVNVVCPGYMETEINADFFATEIGQKMIARMPRRRLMELKDPLPMMVMLGSDVAKGTTGGVFVVDDGQIL